MLLSEDFVRLLSPGIRQRVRQIDCVTVKGSRQPIGLYTYDMSVDGLEILSGITSTQSKACRAAALAICEQAVLPPVLPQPPAAWGTHGGNRPSLLGVQGTPVPGADTSKPLTARSETYSLSQYKDEYSEHPDIVMSSCVDQEFLALFASGGGGRPQARGCPCCLLLPLSVCLLAPAGGC
jgi:hypothetical protein